MTQRLYYKYWGKTGTHEENGDVWHLLPYHSLDVAAVGKILGESMGIFDYFSKRLSCHKEEIKAFIIFMCAIHDIGKFSEGFQNLCPDLFKILQNKSSRAVYQEKHWSIGYSFLLENADRIINRDRFDILDYLGSWFSAVSGHHGRPPITRLGIAFDPNQFAMEEATTFMKDVYEFFKVSEDISFLFSDEGKMKELSWILAGFMVLTDWIGSDEKSFPFKQDSIPLKEYWEKFALPNSEKATYAIGILPIKPISHRSITSLFPWIKSATLLQEVAETISVSDNGNLYILEDLTGSGKTEAALILTSRLMSAGFADGYYFALPTMATANAMHDRIELSYRKFFEAPSEPTLVLAHSSSKYRLILNQLNYETIDPEMNGEKHFRADEWLSDNRKKALLAHVGVGTIDQALLAILPAWHQSLRIFGLHRKVMIIDEVHAYDPYVNKLLRALLEFHASYGGSAILLSATLPAALKRQLLESYCKGKGRRFDDQFHLNNAYPLVTSIINEKFSEVTVNSSKQSERTVNVRLVHSEEEILANIKAVAESGKCVCWIRNTVFDAQDAYDRIFKELGADRVILFHARFTLGDRLEIEKTIVKLFGKDSTGEDRRGKIVIATQVVEQSLDIDFDYLITDLAPIDLVIQRAGRLCRHRRNSKGDRFERDDMRGIPELVIFTPELDCEISSDWYQRKFPKASYVYEHHGQLWLTADWFKRKMKFLMPDDAREMIEFVYGEDSINKFPEVLTRREDQAGGGDRAMAGLAQYNSLQLQAGYLPDGMRWMEDEKIPTRIGDIRNTVRLGKVENGQIEPYYFTGQQGDWVLSDVSISRNWVAKESEADFEMIKKVKDTMPDKGKYCIVVLLEQHDNDYIGHVLDINNRVIEINYNKTSGFKVKK